MGSMSVDTVREMYPGKTDEEAAAAMAARYGYVIVLRYKLFPDKPYSNFATCERYEEADRYLWNSNLHDVEVIYDRRSTKDAVAKVTHNAQAVTRAIEFDEDGHASARCCWNCRHFNVSLSGTHLCCRDALGRGVVEVQRADLCAFWQQR